MDQILLNDPTTVNVTSLSCKKNKFMCVQLLMFFVSEKLWEESASH